MQALVEKTELIEMADDTAGAGISLTVANNAVVVRGVAMGSPAALSSQIAVGDVLVKVNGTVVGADRYVYVFYQLKQRCHGF